MLYNIRRAFKALTIGLLHYPSTHGMQCIWVSIGRILIVEEHVHKILVNLKEWLDCRF